MEGGPLGHAPPHSDERGRFRPCPDPSLSIIGLVVLALVVTACGETPPPSTSPDAESPAAESPAEESPAESAAESAEPTEAPSGEGRLAEVQARGTLICGVNGALPGFSFLDEATGENSGFDVDFCRALAAAVLGDPEAVEFRNVATDQRGPLLQSGDIDVLIRNTTWTVSRDTAWGLFGPTTFYDGQAIMVNSTLTDATEIDDLAGATVCVQTGTTTELNLTDSARGFDHAADLPRDRSRPTPPTRKDVATRSPATDRSWLPGGRRSRIPTIT